MHHYRPSVMVIWLFILLAVLLVGVLLYFAPRMMKYLDDWAERRNKKIYPKKRGESQRERNSK